MTTINKQYYDEGCETWEARTSKALDYFEEIIREEYKRYDWEDKFFTASGAEWDEGDWWEFFMEEVAKHAYEGHVGETENGISQYYNIFGAKTVEEAYFVICEVMSIEEANEWLAEWLEEEDEEIPKVA